MTDNNEALQKLQQYNDEDERARRETLRQLEPWLEPPDPEPTLDEIIEGADEAEARYTEWLFGERHLP